MKRTWTDSRDGVTWTVEAIPAMGEVKPGEALPMIGETNYRLRFTSPNSNGTVVVPPAIGGALPNLSDAELRHWLDRARGKGFPPETKK